MAYYNVCQRCGGHLDPGEKCDCEEERAREQEKKQDFFSQHLKEEPKAGQLAFAFDSREVCHESKSYC